MGQPLTGGSPIPPPPPADGGEAASDPDDQRWQSERDDYIHTRLARVQASAQAWLATLGTILGLSGTVLVFKGPETLTDTTGNPTWRIALLSAGVLVFFFALAAVLLAASATWGGLRAATDDATGGGRWRTVLRALGSGFAWRAQRKVQDGRPEPERVNGLLMGVFAWLRPDPEPAREWTCQEYRSYVEDQANARRRYLHRSRLCGLLAGIGAGLLFLLALVLASIHRPPAPSGPTVIAVHGGRLSCGPLTHDSRGEVLISGQRLTDVTQILPTDHC